MAAAEHLDLIDRHAERIVPDDVALKAWCAQYFRSHRQRLADDLSHIERELPSGALLELGSSPPFLTAALKEAGREVVGVDIAPDRFARCTEELGLDIRACDIEREAMPFGDGEFGGVIFNEIFEHLRIDLIHTMSEIARVTAPGGRVMLTTPNMRSARGLISLAVRGRSAFLCPNVFEQYEKLRSIGHMGHVREYTERDVLELCSKTGFSHRTTIWRRAARASVFEKAVCGVVPSLRPSMSIILDRAGSM